MNQNAEPQSALLASLQPLLRSVGSLQSQAGTHSSVQACTKSVGRGMAASPAPAAAPPAAQDNCEVRLRTRRPRMPPPEPNGLTCRSPPLASPDPVQAPGAEFFRRRLQRALAVPPEQRDPAVHAFVTSVQLMQAERAAHCRRSAGAAARHVSRAAGGGAGDADGCHSQIHRPWQ